jgi:hypothetical protein
MTTKLKALKVKRIRCPMCRSLNTRYVADYSAPGIGQHWECEHGHGFAVIRGRAHLVTKIMTPEEVV